MWPRAAGTTWQTTIRVARRLSFPAPIHRRQNRSAMATMHRELWTVLVQAPRRAGVQWRL